MVSIKFVLLIFSIALTGCQLPYLLRNGYEQTKILAQRESLEKVLAKDSVTENVKHKLRLATEAKSFAEEHLGLAATKNYSSYVDLNRPFVSWIVQASKEYELTPFLWDFPIVGSLPYKGFFSLNEAQTEASSFDKTQYDTYVRGVTAYSTLGWFKDPLLNTMMSYSDPDLVELIIHESVHATLYIKSEAEFNERLATFIGQLGSEKFYLIKEGENSETVRQIKLERIDQKMFSEFLSKEIRLLEDWYKDNKDSITPEQKARRLGEIQDRFKSDLLRKLQTDSLHGALRGELNNAVLVGLKTYQMDLEDFEKLYEKLGRDMNAFIKYCKGLEGQTNPSQELKDFLEPSESAADLVFPHQPTTRNKVQSQALLEH